MLNFLQMKEGGLAWKVNRLAEGDSPRAVNLRWSPKWVTDQPFIRVGVQLPFIDPVGKFSGSASYLSNISPGGYIGTVVSTIHRRLFFYVSRRLKSKVRAGKLNKLLLACSAYYALTKNVYFWDRLLAMLRSGVSREKISSCLRARSRTLDDYRWFVYNRCCQQANWLTSRAVRPRDKSSLKLTDRCGPARGHTEKSKRQFEYDAIWYTFTKVSQMTSEP
jgi:hypothetical protein